MQLRIIPAVVASYLCFVQAQAPPASSDSCFTPDGQEGECVSISSCQHVSSLLEEPDDDKTAFLRASVCSGASEYSVCCGSHPPEFRTPPPEVCSSTTALPWPKSGCCGLESYTGDRIIGGVDASIDQYPWMTLIEYTKGTQIKLLCGGALISGRYVLTAAHCVVGPVLNYGIPRNVRLGEYDTSNDPKNPDCVIVSGGGEDCTTGVVVIPIEKITAHEEYNPNNQLRKHDIALLRLTRMAPYSEYIKPICLPTTDITLVNLPDIKFYVAGWGAINDTHRQSLVKQHVDVPYRTKDQCQAAYSVGRSKVALWNGQICAGGELKKDTCKGDSGGPLMYENRKTFEIVGVVSFGPTACGIEDVPGVYTKVFEYLPWIRKNIKP